MPIKRRTVLHPQPKPKSFRPNPKSNTMFEIATSRYIVVTLDGSIERFESRTVAITYYQTYGGVLFQFLGADLKNEKFPPIQDVR